MGEKSCLSYDVPTNKPDWYTENAVWFAYNPKKGFLTEYSKYGNKIIPNQSNRLISDEAIDIDNNSYGVSTINGKLRQLTIHNRQIIYRINNTPDENSKCDKYYSYNASIINSEDPSVLFDILDSSYVTNKFADKMGFANLTVNGRTGETMQLSGFSIGAESSIQMGEDEFVKVILRAETNKNISGQPTFIMKVTPNFDFKGYLQLTVEDYGDLKSPEINIPKGATYLYTFSKEEVEKVIGITHKEENTHEVSTTPSKPEEKKKYLAPISTRDLIIHPDDAIFDRKTGIALKISLIDATTKHKYRITINPDNLINRLNKETIITKYEAANTSIYQFIKTDGAIYFDKENRSNYINFTLTITHHNTDKTELPSIELKLWKFDHVEPFSAYLDIASNRKFIFHNEPSRKITINKENNRFEFKYSALVNKVYCY